MKLTMADIDYNDPKKWYNKSTISDKSRAMAKWVDYMGNNIEKNVDVLIEVALPRMIKLVKEYGFYRLMGKPVSPRDRKKLLALGFSNTDIDQGRYPWFTFGIPKVQERLFDLQNELFAHPSYEDKGENLKMAIFIQRLVESLLQYKKTLNQYLDGGQDLKSAVDIVLKTILGNPILAIAAKNPSQFIKKIGEIADRLEHKGTVRGRPGPLRG